MKTNITELYATLEAVTKTANEVRELLQKSMPPVSPAPFAKAEDDKLPPPPHAEPDADQSGGPSDGDADNVPPPPPPTDGAVPPPEGGGEQVDEFAQEIASMSDEELDMLLQALASEMEKRQGSQSPEGAPAPEAPVPAPSPEMEAMKSENLNMRKSLQTMEKEIAALKKSVSAKPVSMNKPPLAVAQKTTKEMEPLSKSEVITHLESLKKSGNRKVDTDLIWAANACKTVEEMKDVYHAAKLKGIDIPSK